MAKHQRDRAKESRWRARLRRRAASGLSVRGFCRREGVAESAFYFWRRVIAERDAERTLSSPPSPALPASEPASALPCFVPVAVTGPPVGAAPMAIELVGGRVLRLPESIPAAWLAELVHAIESRGQA